MQLPSRLKADHFKPKERLRSTAHRNWVRGHYCSVPGCQLMPIEVAHVRSAATAGMGMKSSDAFTLSLCAEHHGEQHQKGQQTFEALHGFRMIDKAEAFFRASPYRNKLDDPY